MVMQLKASAVCPNVPAFKDGMPSLLESIAQAVFVAEQNQKRNNKQTWMLWKFLNSLSM